MNATETTSLLVANTTSTTLPSNGDSPPQEETLPNHHIKNNNNNNSSSSCGCCSSSSSISSHAYHIGIGFSFGLFVSCIVMIAFVLGYLLSTDVRYNNKILQSSSSAAAAAATATAAAATTDSTMQVITTTKKGWDDTTATASSLFQYVATQFISFTINTMGGLQEHGECDENTTVDPISGVCYLGDAHNITHDVEHRLEIVKTVLKRIKLDSFQESPDIDHVDNVLKIVSLPEFFWRGPFGAYTIEEVNTMYVHFVRELRHMILDDFYNDFIFCFGTIIAARPVSSKSSSFSDTTTKQGLNDESHRTMSRHATEMEYFNFAPISRGGTNHHSYIVTKQYISTADFLSRSDTLPNPTEENVRDYADFDPELQTFFERQANITIVKENVIVIDGIRIGIEICLDHRLGVLWNNILSRHHGTALVDVLLITSAGMAIERGPNPIVPGGVVYLCDGSASSAACIRSSDETIFHPNQVCRGDTNIIGLKHIPVGSPGYSNFIELSACWDMEDDHLLRGYYSLYQPQGCAFTLFTYGIDVMDEFKFYPPSIEIYPTIALPSR